jgi:PAS domain S-box-containing protein
LLLLTDVIPQQIWEATAEGAIDSCNRRLLDYAGRPIEQMQGERFLETIHSEDREDFHRRWREALSAGKPFEGEWRVRGADGGYRWFFTRAVPLRGQDGKILRWYGTNTDIEQRHQAEQALKHTQAEVAHLARVLSMGELTASIAHEISQPLTAVVSHGQACLEWLAARPPNLDRARDTVDRIVQDGTRAGAVLERIKALYGKEALAKGPLDLNEVIQEVTVFLKDESIQRHVSVRTELGADLPQINGDRVQLQQVLLNLMVNGMDAMTGIDGQTKEIVVSSRKEGTEKVLVSVEDHGAGIPPEAAEKIFDPFFSTKPRGIGMGLSISRSIVESHEGRLWASPRPAGGTIVQFEIPIRAAGTDG